MPKPTFHNLSPDKRARVLEAALDEFAVHSLASASVNRIVKGAGIAKGSFYQYFDGLDDLYRFLIFDHAADAKIAAFQAAGPPPAGDLFDSLAWYGFAGLRWGLEHPRLAAAARHVRGGSVHPSMAAIAEEVTQRSRDWLRQLLRDGQQTGAVRPELDLDAAAVLADVVFRHGYDEVFRDRFGLDVISLCAHPERAAAFSDDDLRAAVRAVIDLLRHGLGTGAGTHASGRIDLDRARASFRDER